jgi:predicted nucleic acid-binding protein
MKCGFKQPATSFIVQLFFRLLECFQVLELEESVYEVFASLSARLLSEGKPIGAFDELIASITLLQEEQIVTRNECFKKVQGLEVISY